MASGGVIAYRSPRAREDATSFLGMVFFLASWAIMFAALFFAYGMVRTRTPAWPPLDVPAIPVGQGAWNTIALALSSVALQWGLDSARRGRAAQVAPALLASVLLGAAFLALQTAAWLGLYQEGLRPDSGPYGSVFYALTCFHALHVVVGLAALGVLAWRAFAGSLGAARHLSLRLWTLYWHFVGVVWGLIFALVYLV